MIRIFYFNERNWYVFLVFAYSLFIIGHYEMRKNFASKLDFCFKWVIVADKKKFMIVE